MHKHWKVDLEEGRATPASTGRYGQLYPQDKRWNAAAVARELAQLIRNGSRDEWLEWRSEGEVRVLLPLVLPLTGAKQTREGRARRFRKALKTELGDPWNYDRGIRRRSTDVGMFTDLAGRPADRYMVVSYEQRGHSQRPLKLSRRPTGGRPADGARLSPIRSVRS